MQGASDSPHYKQESQSYVGFLNWAEELSDRDIEVFKRYENWLNEVEKTVTSKSYKMVVLLAMLLRGVDNWYKSISSHKAAPFFHQCLMKKEYRKRIDFSDKGAKKLWNHDENGVSKLIETILMTRWSGSSKGLISYEKDFHFELWCWERGLALFFNRVRIPFGLAHKHTQPKDPIASI
ncbi:hypothetical protein [Neobacillus sp. PS3-40]|uniref:hypothetical protein n=1 Tax=Neobacillus sp. PS3-40 TaxID=3070679 RepID=UPI0027DEB452|nr:hypothetical protein [Neobacillus sp. PS3-40]WML44347.1 hypothetical protein RCG20_00025 [Neobacillus sp. PS3-40]